MITIANIFYGVIGLVIAYIGYRNLIKTIVVWEPFEGMLYKNGSFVRRLAPGRYRYFNLGNEFTVKLIDLRLRNLTISGQELLTADNAGIKVSLVVAFKVTDPEKAESEVAELDETIYSYAQIALRSAVGKRAIEDLIEQRAEIGDEIKEAVAGNLEAIGIEIRTVGIKDVMLPGELKAIMNEVLRAKKAGQVALEKARGESAAIRNLANAARLLESNPGLMNLKVLETIGQTYNNTYVMGLPQELFQFGGGKERKDK